MSLDHSLPLAEFTGALLMLVLGLRHGLEPDHLALIDALNLRLQQRQPALAPWVGFWFSVGHGAVVMLVCVLAYLGAQHFEVPGWLSAGSGWLPLLLLFAVGSANLWSLLRRPEQVPPAWRLALLPRGLRELRRPWQLVLIGALFAAVVETLTQAAAWGAVAASQGSVAWVLLTGGAFALGMLLSDTLDSQLLARVLDRRGPSAVSRRRLLAWISVGLAYGVVVYALVQRAACASAHRHAAAAASLGFGADLGILLGLMSLLALAVLCWHDRRCGLGQ